MSAGGAVTQAQVVCRLNLSSTRVQIKAKNRYKNSWISRLNKGAKKKKNRLQRVWGRKTKVLKASQKTHVAIRHPQEVARFIQWKVPKERSP